VPALRAGLREELYMVLAGWGNRGETATFKAHINPLASFLWLGGLVFLVGGAVALWPTARTVHLAAPEARRRAVGTIVGLAVGLLVLIAAVIAMWGGSIGVEAGSAGRPLRGQSAPNFTLDLLDGSTLSLSDLRGQVVVINFWATWCSPCEDELPDLQAVWDEYQSNDVVFVGVAYEDTTAAVQEIASRFGITYPQGIDEEARISTAYGITGVPETFLLDAQGKVAFSHIGQVTAAELREELDSLLGR
jgi:peroxiredoxin